MKEVIVHPLPELHTAIHDVDVPIPKDHEMVIKVIVAGSNVKDWLHITNLNLSLNSGDDIAGTIHILGSSATAASEFHVGDRVAAFHPMLTAGGAYAEYAVAPMHTVFHLPEHTTLEEAATIPLTAMTAALSLFRRQSLPPPWEPRSSTSAPIPLIVYGASSALGCFAIKLARASNIHPIIAICGPSRDYVSGLLDPSKGDILIDYRKGKEAMIQDVRKALGGLDCKNAIDAISAKRTWIAVSQMLDPDGAQLSVVAGSNRYDDVEIPATVEIKYTYVGTTHEGAYKASMPKQPVDREEVENDIEFAYVMFRYFGRMLAEGRFEGHPVEVVPGGLDGVETGLRKLKDGMACGRKFVYRICDGL